MCFVNLFVLTLHLRKLNYENVSFFNRGCRFVFICLRFKTCRTCYFYHSCCIRSRYRCI